MHDVAEYYKAGTFGGAIRTSRSRLYAQDKAEKATQRVKHLETVEIGHSVLLLVTRPDLNILLTGIGRG